MYYCSKNRYELINDSDREEIRNAYRKIIDTDGLSSKTYINSQNIWSLMIQGIDDGASYRIDSLEVGQEIRIQLDNQYFNLRVSQDNVISYSILYFIVKLLNRISNISESDPEKSSKVIWSELEKRNLT